MSEQSREARRQGSQGTEGLRSGLWHHAYATVAELWCSPQDMDVAEVQKAAQEFLLALEEMDGEGASHLKRFLACYPPNEEEYVELFELNPRCPLYLGSHVFDEPRTCAQAAVSDRSEYMIELIAIYKHFGLSLKGREMPDYLPLMVEFLALTAETEDPIREKFIREYLLPFLPPLRQRLEALSSPYRHLYDELEWLLKLDLTRKGAQPSVFTAKEVNRV